MRSSPRASIGLSMLPASIAPSAPPAPTTVCSSSMNVITSPPASAISFRTAFSRSSNSPRYLEPAIIDPRSREMMRLCLRLSGTSPSTMRRARPSTMAVLPTPGSPISTGLFLVRRDSTWMVRRISSSRPMTGSSLPLRASAVRSRPYFSSAWNCSSGFCDVTRCDPRTSLRASSTSSRATPILSVRASSTCSIERYSSPNSTRSRSACSSASRAAAAEGRDRRRRRPWAAWRAPREPGPAAGRGPPRASAARGTRPCPPARAWRGAGGRGSPRDDCCSGRGRRRR